MENQQIIITTPEKIEEIIKTCFLSAVRKIEEEKESNNKLLTITQVMERLNVKRCTLWRWNKTKYLPVTKIGKKVLYRESDVKAIENSLK